PPELRGTMVHFVRRLRRPLEPTVDHRLSVAVEMPSALRSRVQSLVLRAPGGAVVLDCEAATPRHGLWGTDTGLLADRFCMADVVEGQIGDGTYRLDIKLAGRARTFRGTFPVERA